MMSYIQKYPALAPAFEYMDIYADRNHLDPLLCAKMAKIQMRACQLIDENIDRSDAEKNVLIAGAVFSLVPVKYLQQVKPEGFGQAIDQVVDDLIAYKNASGRKASLDVSQIIVATSTALAEDLLEKLKNGGLNVWQLGDAARLAEAPKNYPRDMIGISAERLLKAYRSAGEKLALALQPKKPPAPSKPSF